VSAPGKVLLCGEYAVLSGGVAVVAAAPRRAFARVSRALVDGSASTASGSPETGTIPPEALLAVRKAEAMAGAVQGHLALDTSALRAPDGRKLGLGSSAAGAVAAAAAVLAAAGRDVGGEARTDVLKCAMAGHEAVAPRGSGTDVASAVFGGFLRCRRRDGVLEARALSAPKGLHVSVVWTGRPARTSDLLDAVASLEERDAANHGTCMAELRAVSAGFADAWERADLAEIILLTDAFRDALERLGAAADAPILTAELRAASDLARAAGGAAKPSGAGGGDVAVAFFASPGGAREFERTCAKRHFRLLKGALGSAGVRSESPP
jgi:phosphomevalonate kinase